MDAIHPHRKQWGILSCFRELGELLPADGGDCEAVLAAFAKAGVDVDALAAQLQAEGAKSFVNSWHELMEVITSKSAALEKPVRPRK
jgi:transaldolase